MMRAAHLRDDVAEVHGAERAGGAVGKPAVLDGLKAEIQKLVNAFTSDEYNLPLSAS